ncbi:MAG: type II secretion system F family protein [Candidatus Altiarchaeota archaeon]
MAENEPKGIRVVKPDLERVKNAASSAFNTVSWLFKLVFWAVNMIVRLFTKFLNVMGSSVKLLMTHIPRLLSKILPKRVNSILGQQLIYAGVEMTPAEVISLTLVYSTVLTAVAYVSMLLLAASQLVTSVILVVIFCLVWSLPLLLLNILATNRANAVELTLPDILSMVAQNMSAGMTSYNALWSAARPEFGPLAVEIQDVAKATLTGIPMADALMGMTNHVKSTKLLRVVRLIIQGMKSGGELPTVLQAISSDMRREDNLRKQMGAETTAQAIFILFAVLVGAPLLFAVSAQFITIFSTMMEKLNVQDLSKNAPQGMITISQLSITPEFFQTYAIGILFVSAFFGSLLLGILKTGNPLSGLSTTPLLITVSIGIFLLIKHGLGLLFAGMITF